MNNLLLSLLLIMPTIILGQSYRYTIYFETGKSELSKESALELEKAIATIKSAAKYTVEITGHTDSVGDEAYNTNLSLNRAFETYSFLLSKGINAENCSFKGFSFSKPLLPNNSEKNKQLNRRVEIYATIEPISITNESIENSEIIELEKDTVEKITYTAERGSTVKFEKDAFAPYKLEDLTIEIEEVYEPMEMIDKKILTQTTNGNCLSSFGMLFIRVIKPDGSEIGNANSLIEIKMPAIKGTDKLVELFSTVKQGENTVWKPMEGKLIIDSTDQKPYYVFYTTLVSGFNLDKIIPCGTPTTITERLYVSKQNRTKVYIINPTTNNVKQASSIGKNRYEISYTNTSQTIYIKGLTKRNLPVEFNKSIYSLKYSKFRKAYVVRKSDFRPANFKVSGNEFGELLK